MATAMRTLSGPVDRLNLPPAQNLDPLRLAESEVSEPDLHFSSTIDSHIRVVDRICDFNTEQCACAIGITAYTRARPSEKKTVPLRRTRWCSIGVCTLTGGYAAPLPMNHETESSPERVLTDRPLAVVHSSSTVKESDRQQLVSVLQADRIGS